MNSDASLLNAMADIESGNQAKDLEIELEDGFRTVTSARSFRRKKRYVKEELM